MTKAKNVPEVPEVEEPMVEPEVPEVAVEALSNGTEVTTQTKVEDFSASPPADIYQGKDVEVERVELGNGSVLETYT